jgi:hypothetical protein
LPRSTSRSLHDWLAATSHPSGERPWNGAGARRRTRRGRGTPSRREANAGVEATERFEARAMAIDDPASEPCCWFVLEMHQLQ